MTLTLILKKQWFDKIKNGEKFIEYREAKPYWDARLNKPFNKVIFKNGYHKNAPALIADVLWVERLNGKGTDLDIDKDVYAIKFRNVRAHVA